MEAGAFTQSSAHLKSHREAATVTQFLRILSEALRTFAVYLCSAQRGAGLQETWNATTFTAASGKHGIRGVLDGGVSSLELCEKSAANMYANVIMIIEGETLNALYKMRL